jgi:hypothetical protein
VQVKDYRWVDPPVPDDGWARGERTPFADVAPRTSHPTPLTTLVAMVDDKRTQYSADRAPTSVELAESVNRHVNQVKREGAGISPFIHRQTRVESDQPLQLDVPIGDRRHRP